MRIFFFIFYIFFIFSFNTSSNDIISKIEKNWNKTRSMSGTFIQLDTDGNYSEGNFYFLKPYLSKFEYKDKKENIITNETLLRLVDKDGYQIESYSIGTTLAARTEDRINANQELIALGLANLGAGVTGAYPVAGSFSRSSVNFAAGGRTPVSSLVCALVIILTLLFFANLFVTLPNAVLAAIVMTSVLGLIDFSKIRNNWRIYRDDSLTELATLLLVLVVGVELGLLAGVALSVALFIRNSSQPNITQVGRLGESEQFRSVKRYPVNLHEQILALRIDENIFFANAVQIEEKLLRRVLGRHGTKHLLLVCNAVNRIDATGLSMLLRVNQQLQSSGVQLHFSDIKGPLMQQLDQTELARGISGEIFFNADQAFKSLTGDSTAAHANP